mmetsp:Transcript_83463/g.258040  ORF Transcript_83463/g.258040 Transcript_83463/m.258040 type:complete len:347 (+) Transcript_83463:512-1552(+)
MAAARSASPGALHGHLPRPRHGVACDVTGADHLRHAALSREVLTKSKHSAALVQQQGVPLATGDVDDTRSPLPASPLRVGGGAAVVGRRRLRRVRGVQGRGVDREGALGHLQRRQENAARFGQLCRVQNTGVGFEGVRLHLLSTAELSVRPVSPRVHRAYLVQRQAEEGAQAQSIDAPGSAVQRRGLRIIAGDQAAPDLPPEVQEVCSRAGSAAALPGRLGHRAARGIPPRRDGCDLKELPDAKRYRLVIRHSLHPQGLPSPAGEDLCTTRWAPRKEKGVVVAACNRRDSPRWVIWLFVLMRNYPLQRAYDYRTGSKATREENGLRLVPAGRVADAQLAAMVPPVG